MDGCKDGILKTIVTVMVAVADLRGAQGAMPPPKMPEVASK